MKSKRLLVLTAFVLALTVWLQPLAARADSTPAPAAPVAAASTGKHILKVVIELVLATAPLPFLG